MLFAVLDWLQSHVAQCDECTGEENVNVYNSIVSDCRGDVAVHLPRYHHFHHFTTLLPASEPNSCCHSIVLFSSKLVVSIRLTSSKISL